MSEHGGIPYNDQLRLARRWDKVAVKQKGWPFYPELEKDYKEEQP